MDNLKLFKAKVQFVKDLADLLVPVSYDINSITYEVYEHFQKGTTEEFLVITSGNDVKVKPSNGDSLGYTAKNIARALIGDFNGYSDRAREFYDLCKNSKEYLRIA